MTARNQILARLRQFPAPFATLSEPSEQTVMVPLDPADALDQFVQQAQRLSAHAYRTPDPRTALEIILRLLGSDKRVLAWDFEHIPLPGLPEALASQGVAIADARDASVRVGITGVDAALAATGSIIVSAQPGRPRSVSLLPQLHIAVIRPDQILLHLDAWLEQQQRNLPAFRAVGNHVVITGASRTADIAMELVLGAHGPAQLHLVLLP